MVIKTSLIDRWNVMAKKKIYINDTLEIGVGKLIFTGIIVALQAIPILIITGNWAAACITLAGFLTSFRQREKKSD